MRPVRHLIFLMMPFLALCGDSGGGHGCINKDDRAITLFLCGDVMTGRGIDQILPHPSDPRIYESYIADANDYVEIAEGINGPIPRPVLLSYIWGDALDILKQQAPDLRIINLETSVTTENRPWPKGINYRMNPMNVGCLTAADIDCCVLANNHVLDWGYEGLRETLSTLHNADIKTAGAGMSLVEAEAPAIFDLKPRGRVLIFSFGFESSGIFESWAATDETAGVNLLPDFTDQTIQRVTKLVGQFKRRRDVVVASIHWGGNWGYDIPSRYSDFAHHLITTSGIDLIHGHSSHHVKGLEVYRGKLILYGCGDFLNDYEGIRGHEKFRDDLALMYFPTINPVNGHLIKLELVPTRTRKLRVNRTSLDETQWLMNLLNREGRIWGTKAALTPQQTLQVHWKSE